MKDMKQYIKTTIQEFLKEELNISNTYFTKKKDNKNILDFEFKKIILDVCNKLEIKLPVKPFSKEFISIKKMVDIEIKNNIIIKEYFDEFGYNKKEVEDILLKICSDTETKKIVNKTQKINITHLDFKLVDNVNNVETYQVIFPDDIKKIIIDNYSTNKLDYLIYINCESNSFNRLHFPGRIDRWYRAHDKRFGKDEQPQPYKGKHGKWIADLFDGIPETLRGTGIGYAIYKEFIKFKGYLSSNSWSSSLSQSVWKKLSADSELCGILVNYAGQNGDIILFDKKYKGDYNKVGQEFIEHAKKGKLYRGDDSKFEIKNIEIDEYLKKFNIKSE